MSSKFTWTDVERLNAKTMQKHLGDGEGVSREKDLHDEILTECRRRGWICLHSRMDKATTSNIGCADFVILKDGGKVDLVEAKTAKGKLSPAQLAFGAWATKLGFTYRVVRNFSEFANL